MQMFENSRSKMDPDEARETIRDLGYDVITAAKVVMPIAKQEELLEELCEELLVERPLELLMREDIEDIRVNSAGQILVEVGGTMHETGVYFRQASELLRLCQHLSRQVSRQVSDFRRICDFQTLDGPQPLAH